MDYKERLENELVLRMSGGYDMHLWRNRVPTMPERSLNPPASERDDGGKNETI